MDSLQVDVSESLVKYDCCRPAAHVEGYLKVKAVVSSRSRKREDHTVFCG
jgi:hypothetical protein